MSSKSGHRHGKRSVGRLLRRLNVRFTLWFGIVFLGSSLLVFGLTFMNLYRILRADDQREIQTRALSYVVQFRSAATPAGGVNAIVNAIEAESTVIGEAPYFSRLATVDNQTIYMRYPLIEWQQEFDLASLLQASVPHSQGFLSVHSDSLGYQLEIFAIPLSPELVLQLGYSTQNRVQILQLFERSFLLIFAVLLGASTAGGFLFISRTLRPIGTLNEEIRRIVDTGQLDRRLESRESGDDLDELVGSFNAMLDRLRTLVHSLTDALDSVAHDLRTPMTRFRTSAEHALASEDPALHAEALSDTLEESDRMLSMLNAMMDISEAESGAMRLNRDGVLLGPLCDSVADVYTMVAEEKGMTIDVQVEDHLTASVDTPRMRQVIGNLLDNAIKYGTPGTSVEVRGRRIVLPGDRSGASVEVSNHGIPIPPESLSRIWDRLYRGPGDNRREGIGLGLTLVRAIVTAHGGSVDVVSGDEITVFTITIPADA